VDLSQPKVETTNNEQRTINSPRRNLPPLWIFLILFFFVYALLSVGLTMACKLPWHVPIPLAPGMVAGTLLLVFGFAMMVWTLRSLGLRRAAFDKELFESGSNSSLVTTGAYAYSRNPLYFSATVLFLGWFFVSRWTPIAIMATLFFIHFMLCAKWEEREMPGGSIFGTALLLGVAYWLYRTARGKPRRQSAEN